MVPMAELIIKNKSMKSVQYIGQTDISSSGVIFEEKYAFLSYR